MKIESFSSSRLDSGQSNGLPITSAVISYDGRQISFTPGVSIETAQTIAYALFWIGIGP